MLESVLADLVEAIKANTAVTAQLLAGRTVTADPAEAKPAKAEPKVKAKEVTPPAAAAKPAPLAVVEPEPDIPNPVLDTPDPDLDGPTEVETEVVVTDADLRAAIQPRLAAKDSVRFKEGFRQLRADYGIAGISELTDANRGAFLAAIQAL